MSSHGELRHRSQSQKGYVGWPSSAASCRSLPSKFFFFPSCTVSPCELPGVPWAPERSGTVKPNTGPRIIRTEGGGGVAEHQDWGCSTATSLDPGENFHCWGGMTDGGFCCLRPLFSSLVLPRPPHQPYSSFPTSLTAGGWADRGPRVTVECSSGRDSPPPCRPGLAFASSSGRDDPRTF